MICPYIVHQMIILQADHDDDTDTQIEIHRSIPMQCQKEACAAWQGGRCRYNSSE